MLGINPQPGEEVLMTTSLDAQGGLPGLIMRLKSDGHGEVQIIGPQGNSCDFYPSLNDIKYPSHSLHCLHAALQAQIQHSKPYLTAVCWSVVIQKVGKQRLAI